MIIPLSRGLTAEIDEVDADLAQFKWSATFNGRGEFRGPVRRVEGKSIYLTHVIVARMGFDRAGRIVDHKDRNPANNRRSNLRLATPKQSQHNRSYPRSKDSGFYGVTWDTGIRKWRARATSPTKQRRNLGHYNTALAAALARDQYVKEVYGEFAVLNEDAKLQEEAITPHPL